MPWSNQSGGGGGGGGGGGWKGGGGPGGPWGQRPSGGGPGQQPDLEEILKRGQDRLKQALPGGGLPGPLLFLIGAVAAAMVAFFTFTFTVRPDQVGVVLRFGKFVRQEVPGLHFRLPYPVEEVYLPSFTSRRSVEIGMRNSGPAREESLMLTGDENIVDLEFVVFWQMKDAKDFLFNIRRPEQTVKDVAESAMREVVGKNEIQPILTGKRKQIEDEVHKLMQATLDNYRAGIQITQIQMQKVDPPREVIDAFRDVQAARADQERVQNEAEKYRNQVILEAKGNAERILQEAEGYKQKQIAEATGQASRFLKVYEEYKKAPVVTRQRLYLEGMERVMGSADKIIIDGKAGGGGVVPYLPLNELMKPKTGGGN